MIWYLPRNRIPPYMVAAFEANCIVEAQVSKNAKPKRLATPQFRDEFDSRVAGLSVPVAVIGCSVAPPASSQDRCQA
jgi:hypothetical protein